MCSARAREEAALCRAEKAAAAESALLAEKLQGEVRDFARPLSLL